MANGQNAQIGLLKRQVAGLEAALKEAERKLREVKIDAQQVREENEKLRELQSHDPMTGLRTRNSIAEEVEHHFSMLRRAREHVRKGVLVNTNEQEFSLLFIDLNDFKKVNDTHGHAAGDTILRVFAEYCKAHFRAGDVVARRSGDEFLVLLTGVTPKEKAERIKAKFLSALSKLRVQVTDDQGTEHTLGVRCSVGVSSTSDEHANFEEMETAADADMYAHKKASKTVGR